MSPFATLAVVASATALIAQDGTSTAGFARTAWRVEHGEMPRSDEVVVADLIDYHHHSLPPPKAGEAVALDVRCLTAPAALDGEAWLEIGISTARSHGRDELPPVELALAVDCSGSMADDGKMATVHAGLRRLVERLRPDDRLAIVAWSDHADLVLPLARVGDGCAARHAIDGLAPTGSTNLEAGLRSAFETLCGDDARAGAIRRVLLLTDGIANVGVTDPEEILRSARRFRERGLDLATIGVGADVNHELLKRLAGGERGLYHFVSARRDLEKVFVDDLEALLVPVAHDVRLDVSLPRGVRVEKIYGHSFEPTRSGFSLGLDDLNGGMTQVVIARLAVSKTPEEAQVAARLTFVETGCCDRRSCSEAVALSCDRCAGKVAVDPEVRKNVAIALLADALHEAARASEEGSPLRARCLLDDALERVHRPARGDDDADLARIVDVVRRARGSLSNCCDRADSR